MKSNRSSADNLLNYFASVCSYYSKRPMQTHNNSAIRDLLTCEHEWFLSHNATGPRQRNAYVCTVNHPSEERCIHFFHACLVRDGYGGNIGLIPTTPTPHLRANTYVYVNHHSEEKRIHFLCTYVPGTVKPTVTALVHGRATYAYIHIVCLVYKRRPFIQVGNDT